MNVLINVFIFILVLFLYIHVNHQFKRSEDLEIYEMDYTTNKNLQEICELKQPVLFEYKPFHPEFFDNVTVDVIEQQSALDVKIKDVNDYWNETANVDYVVLPLQSARTLMTTDTRSNYFTENNEEFVNEAGLYNDFFENNFYLKPDLTVQTKYDILMGSNGAITPLRYHTNYRQFFCVNSGKIHVKMTPWKSSKHLSPTKDFENYEFRSPINVWKPQREYANRMDKLKFLEFDVHEGFVLYVPPFWWYSIKFSNQNDNLVTGITYNSVMNCISNIPNYALYYLQQSNIKKRVAKVLEIPEKEPDEIIPETVPEEETVSDAQQGQI